MTTTQHATKTAKITLLVTATVFLIPTGLVRCFAAPEATVPHKNPAITNSIPSLTQVASPSQDSDKLAEASRKLISGARKLDFQEALSILSSINPTIAQKSTALKSKLGNLQHLQMQQERTLEQLGNTTLLNPAVKKMQNEGVHQWMISTLETNLLEIQSRLENIDLDLIETKLNAGKSKPEINACIKELQCRNKYHFPNTQLAPNEKLAAIALSLEKTKERLTHKLQRKKDELDVHRYEAKRKQERQTLAEDLRVKIDDQIRGISKATKELLDAVSGDSPATSFSETRNAITTILMSERKQILDLTNKIGSGLSVWIPVNETATSLSQVGEQILKLKAKLNDLDFSVKLVEQSVSSNSERVLTATWLQLQDLRLVDPQLGAVTYNGNSKYDEKRPADNLASLNETLVACKANFTKQITKFKMDLDLSIRKFAELQRQQEISTSMNQRLTEEATNLKLLDLQLEIFNEKQ